MSKKENNKLKDLEKNNSISLKMFLISFCGIYQKELFDKKISHDTIKCLFPHLKRTSFEYVLKNTNEVYTGNIILVKDSYGNIAPYLKPNVKESIKNKLIDLEFDGVFKEENNSEDNFNKAIKLENLTLYELFELSKEYKRQKRFVEYRKVCRIIKSNKELISNREYQKKKELLKGTDEYDKYKRK